MKVYDRSFERPEKTRYGPSGESGQGELDRPSHARRRNDPALENVGHAVVGPPLAGAYRSASKLAAYDLLTGHDYGIEMSSSLCGRASAEMRTSSINPFQRGAAALLNVPTFTAAGELLRVV